MTTSTTLLNLVQAISLAADNDQEIVATVAYLINSGKVRLCGTFAGARIDLVVPPSSPALPHSPLPPGKKEFSVAPGVS